MPSVTKCRTNLISDDPASQDNFGSHQRVADAIAELIETSDGGKSIGLEGGWGSGKTSIVEILCKKFKSNSNYFFFKFDAWAHEGDPLRRTFLEALIDELSRPEMNWVSNQPWQEQKEIIAQRREVKEVSNEPNLEKLGIWVIFLIALIPFGNALFTAGLRDTPNLTIDLRSPFAWKVVIGGALTIGPLLAIITSLLFSKKTWKLFFRYISSKINSNKHSIQESVMGRSSSLLWGMLVNRVVTQEITKTNKTANPTSVEFEEKFSELMADALSKKERKIILVLDNLDRIGTAEALKIWATLQTFLHPRTAINAAWLKRLWVLMPYDPEGISALWSKPKSDEEKKENAVQSKVAIKNTPRQLLEANNTTPPAINGRTSMVNENVVALSFLDKSFQLRFEVPPPVLSDWHDYLINIFKEAFPDHKVEDFHNPYRLYVWYLNKKKCLPNPRQIKLYVNQIGSIHRQWAKKEGNALFSEQIQYDPVTDIFPLSHMAYYVLLRRMDYPLVEMVRKGELPEQEVESFIDDNAADNLAALAFNVDVATAKQIVLSDPIRQAFEIRKADTLQELYNEHNGKGFWEALEHLIGTELQKIPNTSLLNIAYCLKECGLISMQNPPDHLLEIESIKNALRKASHKITSWEPLNKELAQDIATLCNLLPEPNIIKSIFTTISTGYPPTSEVKNFDVSSWVAATNLIRDNLPPNLVVAYSKELIEPLSNKLRTQSALSSVQTALLLNCLCELEISNEAAHLALSNLSKDGSILRCLNALLPSSIIDENLYAALGFCIFILLREVPELAIIDLFGEQSPLNIFIQELKEKRLYLQTQVSKKLAFILLRYKGINLILDVLTKNEASRELAVSCLNVLLESHNPSSFFSVQEIQKNWILLFDKLDPEQRRISYLVADSPQVRESEIPS